MMSFLEASTVPIAGTQATTIFYLKDTAKNAKSWSVVQKFTHKRLWSMTENNNDERSGGSGLSYQDDTCECFQVRLNKEIWTVKMWTTKIVFMFMQV